MRRSRSECGASCARALLAPLSPTASISTRCESGPTSLASRHRRNLTPGDLIEHADEGDIILFSGKKPEEACLQCLMGAKYQHAASPDFDPKKHLTKIGLANQTTMDKKETQVMT